MLLQGGGTLGDEAPCREDSCLKEGRGKSRQTRPAAAFTDEASPLRDSLSLFARHGGGGGAEEGHHLHVRRLQAAQCGTQTAGLSPDPMRRPVLGSDGAAVTGP